MLAKLSTHLPMSNCRQNKGPFGVVQATGSTDIIYICDV